MAFRGVGTLACLFALVSARADAAPVLHDVAIATDGALHRGAEATVYVSITGARGLTRIDPVAGATADLVLVEVENEKGKGKAKTHRLASGRTARSGTALLRFRVPGVAPGSYKLR